MTQRTDAKFFRIPWASFGKMNLIGAGRIRVLYHALMHICVVNPVLALSEVAIESLLWHWNLVQFATQGPLLLTYVILLACYHLLISKLQFYYWQVAILVVAFFVVEQQVVASFAFFLGFAPEPIFFDLFSFLACQISRMCW